MAGTGNPINTFMYLFLNGGWIAFLIAMVIGSSYGYMFYIQNKYADTIKWTLLAIDIPQENLQSTKAVEHIFAAMWPFMESINLKEKYIDGKFQQAFSLEIVSIGGYTQFLIRTPVTHKDIVEAAIYGQYPKAEISEVEDYTERFKEVKFPSEEYDLWGSEFGLTKPSPYPIKTYPSFEHSLTQTFADPMGSMLEVFNKVHRDEEMWLQFIITPIHDDWKEEGYKLIDKIIGVEGKKKNNIVDLMLSPLNYIATLTQELFVYGIGYDAAEDGTSQKKVEREGPPNKMLYLTPEERNVVDGITLKISKLGYQTKCRAIFITKKGKMNKPKGAGSFIGALQLFSALDLNAFKPIMKTFTRANYFFVDKRIQLRQNKIMRYFRNRSQTYGWGKGFVFNIEELASIFHFPVPEAMRETVKKVDAKKEAAPVDLPDTIYEEEQVAKRLELDAKKEEEVDNTELGSDSVDDFNRGSDTSVKVEPPADLPF